MSQNTITAPNTAVASEDKLQIINDTLKSQVIKDFQAIDNLVSHGQLSEQQGTTLKNHVVQSALGYAKEHISADTPAERVSRLQDSVRAGEQLSALAPAERVSESQDTLRVEEQSSALAPAERVSGSQDTLRAGEQFSALAPAERHRAVSGLATSPSAGNNRASFRNPAMRAPLEDRLSAMAYAEQLFRQPNTSPSDARTLSQNPAASPDKGFQAKNSSGNVNDRQDLKKPAKDPAREALLEFVSAACPTISADQVKIISDFVERLENRAVERFKRKSEFEKTLKNENENAKSRLCSGALVSTKSKSGLGKVFSRDEIGKMTTDEFRENEAQIMAQLRSGGFQA